MAENFTTKHNGNGEKTNDSSLRINFVLETRDQTQPGSLSLSVGRVGENPGNEVEQIMDTKEPFGGISLITVGDLFQLKPVFDEWIFENSQMGYDALSSNISTEYFTLFELTEIIHQKDDNLLSYSIA